MALAAPILKHVPKACRREIDVVVVDAWISLAPQQWSTQRLTYIDDQRYTQTYSPPLKSDGLLQLPYIHVLGTALPDAELQANWLQSPFSHSQAAIVKLMLTVYSRHSFLQ